MKPTGFTNYVPISETEYGKFRELKNKEANLVKDEINRPAPLLPLAEARNEKDQVLFAPSNNPERQEQRYLQLLNIVTELKKKLEQQETTRRELSQEVQEKTTPSQQQQQQHQQPPQKITFSNIRSASARQKAMALQEMLGQDVWNTKNELVVDGSAVPNSKKEELLSYATTNWRTKYNANKKPVGASNILKLAKEKNIPSKMLGDQARKIVATSSPRIRGLALITKKSKKRKQTDDFRVLTDPKVFQKIMAAKHKRTKTV